MSDDDRAAPLTEEQRERERDRRRRRVRLVGLLVLVALLVILGARNADDVEVDYLFGSDDVRLVWVILVSVIAGAVLERLYTFVVGRRRRKD
jgi:uncharacterized integral membrane protein